MVKKFGLASSILAILLGLGGLLLINLDPSVRGKNKEKDQDQINRELHISDLATLNDSNGHEFYGALFRLSQKREKKVFNWMIEKGIHLHGRTLEAVLENLGYFYDEKEARDLFDKLWNEVGDYSARVALVKSLGKIASSWTGVRVEKIYSEFEKVNDEFMLVHLNASLYSSALSGKQKALAQKRLLYLSAGKEAALALTYLARMIPNHPDLLSSIERAVYQVKDADFLERAILHLAKYHPEWISKQGEKIRYEKNTLVARSFVRTLFISCPQNIFEELSSMLDTFPELKGDIMTTLLSLNRKEALDFFVKNEKKFSGLQDLDQAKVLLQRGEVRSSCMKDIKDSSSF